MAKKEASYLSPVWIERRNQFYVPVCPDCNQPNYSAYRQKGKPKRCRACQKKANDLHHKHYEIKRKEKRSLKNGIS
jgi:tRNA(Ile2) C34 agmatinyltransferase TiaS